MWRYRHLEKPGHREKLKNGNARHQAAWRQQHPGTESLRKKAYKAADQVMNFLLTGSMIGNGAEIRTLFLTFFQLHRRDLLRFFWECLHGALVAPFKCSPHIAIGILYFRDVDAGIRYCSGFYCEENRSILIKRRLGILTQNNACGHKKIQLTFPGVSSSLTVMPKLTIDFETELFYGQIYIQIEKD